MQSAGSIWPKGLASIGIRITSTRRQTRTM
jgi:hypothetical protein